MESGGDGRCWTRLLGSGGGSRSSEPEVWEEEDAAYENFDGLALRFLTEQAGTILQCP